MTYMLGTAGAVLIKSFEKCRLVAYQDNKGVWTIGWGHTGQEVHAGLVWTQAQCDTQFIHDIADRIHAMNQAIGSAPTTQNQFDAMFSLAYNIGIGAFLRSSVLRLHHNGDIRDEPTAFEAWDKCDGAVLNGLLDRRKAEVALYGKVA